MSRRVSWIRAMLVLLAVAAPVAFLLGVWTGDERWLQTGGVLVAALTVSPLVVAAVSIAEVSRDGDDR